MNQQKIFRQWLNGFLATPVAFWGSLKPFWLTLKQAQMAASSGV